jgi:hypothetical protein
MSLARERLAHLSDFEAMRIDRIEHDDEWTLGRLGHSEGNFGREQIRHRTMQRDDDKVGQGGDPADVSFSSRRRVYYDQVAFTVSRHALAGLVGSCSHHVRLLGLPLARPGH